MPRSLFDKDFLVVRRVSVEHRNQHVQSLEQVETRTTDNWRLIIYSYLNDVVVAQPVKSKEPWQGNAPKHNTIAGSSSAHPLSVENNIPETAPSVSGKRRRQPTLTHAGKEERLPLKRKLDFAEESFPEPMSSDGPSLDVEIKNPVNDQDFCRVPTGENNCILDDPFTLSIEDYAINECGSTRLPSGSDVAEIVPPTPSATDFLSTLPGCEQESRHSQDLVVTVISGKKGKQMDFDFVKDVIMDATDTVVKRALEGLSDSTLGDPERRIMLENISQTLPMQVPEVAKVQTMLVRLIGLSKKFEADQLEFKKGSEQDDHIAIEAKLKIKSGHNTSKVAIEDLSALDKKCTETEAQLEELIATLHKLKQEREQRQQAHLVHQSEMKNLMKSLQDAKAGKHTRLAEFEQKTADLKTKASQLLKGLENWRAP